MDKVFHHPNDEMLAAYSAGSLPLSQALCISTHLEHCRDCGHKIERLNHVGSELMQQLKPSAASDDLKRRLFDSLDDLADEAEETPAPQNGINVPRCLRQFVTADYDSLPWRRVSSDIRSVELCRDSNGARVELLKIQPGGCAATHTHLGDEYTVILEGSFSDDSGLYREGDFLLRGEDDEHRPVASQDRECICLAVTEAPIQFTGFFSRLLNPLVRRGYA